MIGELPSSVAPQTMCDWRLGTEWQHSRGEVVTRTRYPDRKGRPLESCIRRYARCAGGVYAGHAYMQPLSVMPLGVRKKRKRIAFVSGVDPHGCSEISRYGWYHESHVRAHMHIGIPVASETG